MYLIMFTTFILVALGVYNIIADRMMIASIDVNKAAQVFNQNDNKSHNLDAHIATLAGSLARYIRIDPYKRRRMETDLKSLNIMVTPEVYKATALVKSGLILLGVIPSLILVPILSIGFIAAAVILYFKSDSDIEEQLRKKKEEIEFELPRFACTLKQELTSSRDVLTILENYKKNAGESLKRELEITIADMRSGNYEAALLRFESRISLSALSDIIRGLIGVLRGDNNINYFEMLSHDLDVLEVQRLENIAMKQPGKIKKYLFLLLASTLIMYITILVVYAYIMVK